MQSKISFFDKGILRNDLKRFGWIGIVYLLALFFMVTLQIIMRYNNLEHYNQNYNPLKRIFLLGENIHTMLILIIPVIAAIFLFRYLHVKKSADMLHSLPIRRENIYNNHILIGVILLVVPVILTGFISWILNLTLNLSNYYTFTDIINWAGITCLMEIFIFQACVFLGMITGISIVQGVLTYIILFLPVGLSLLMIQNMESLVFGFSSYHIEKNVEKLSPLIRVFEVGYQRTTMDYQEILAYAIISVVLFFLAKLLYSKRSIETASQSIAFNILQPVFKYGVTFCCMLVGGIYFWETQHSIYWALFGYFIASLIGYFVAEIILKKSLRVFKNIKGYFIYLVVMMGILVGINYDVIGFERNVPALEEIESIYFGHGFYEYYTDREDYIDFEIEKSDLKRNIYFEKENVINIQNLHKQIINDKPKNKFNKNTDRQVALIFRLRNGKEIVRGYSIERDNYDSYFKPIHESSEYKNMYYNLLNVNHEDIDKITIDPRGNISKRVVITDTKEIQEMVDTLKSEINEITYEEMLDTKEPWAGINILLANDKKIHMTWQKSYLMFEQWLQEKGYLNKARIMPEDIAYVVVEKNDERNVHTYNLDNGITEEKNVAIRMEITDKKMIEYCLRNLTNRWNEDENYHIGFYSEEKNNILQGRLDKNNVPDFIKEFFQ